MAALLLSALLACGPVAPATADLLGHGAPVRDVVLARDGAQAITSGFDDVAIVWSLPEETQRAPSI